MALDRFGAEFYIDDKGTAQLRAIEAAQNKTATSAERAAKKQGSLTASLRQNKEMMMFWVAGVYIGIRAWNSFIDAQRKLDPSSLKEYDAAMGRFNGSLTTLQANLGSGLVPSVGGLLGHLGDIINAMQDIGVLLQTAYGGALLRIMGYSKAVVSDVQAAAYTARELQIQRAQFGARTIKTGAAGAAKAAGMSPAQRGALEFGWYRDDAARAASEFAGGEGEWPTPQDQLAEEQEVMESRLGIMRFMWEEKRKMRAQDQAEEDATVAAAQLRQQQMIDLARAEVEARMGIADAVGNLVNAVAGKSKAAFIISKGLALATTFVAGKQAEMMALASPPGPPATLPLAAMVRTATMLNMAAIGATAFLGMGGGGGGGGGGASHSSAPVMGDTAQKSTTIVIKGKGLENLIESINELTEDGGVRLVATDSFNSQYASYIR